VLNPPPLLLRVSAEVRALLAGDALLDDLEGVISTAREVWRAGQAPYAPGPNGHAARAVLDHLAQRCVAQTGPPTDQSPALELVIGERLRQIEAGHTAARDDTRASGELLDMARWWMDPEADWMQWPFELFDNSEVLPERRHRVDELVRAAALIVAEIDRLIRNGAGT
jgi:hypothetical protein